MHLDKKLNIPVCNCLEETFPLYIGFPLFVDCLTIFLHSPNGRQLPAVSAVQGDCQWHLKKWQNFPPVKWAHDALKLRHSPTFVWIRIITNDMGASWRPCLIPHWQSYCHQARTVKQSTLFVQMKCLGEPCSCFDMQKAIGCGSWLIH